MKLRNFALAAAAACALIFPSLASASSLKDIAAATFKIYGDDGRAYCSTTFLKNDPAGALFLTAAHCVQKPDEGGMNIERDKLDPKDLKTVLSKEIYTLKAAKTIASKDIAVLQLLDKDVTFWETGPDIATVEEANKLSIGDDLLVVGFPAAQVKAVTKGTFSEKIAAILDLEAPMYQTTVPVAPGNSGGALYAQFDGQWKLIGTTTAMRRDNSIMTYFQTAETVNEALRGFGVGIKVASSSPATSDGYRSGPLSIDER